MKVEGATSWKIPVLYSFVCEGEKVFLSFPIRKSFFKGLECPCHQTKEHWSCP